MDVRLRDVPEQFVVTEQRMVDQQGLEKWLPDAMARVHRAAGAAASGTADQPHLERTGHADEPTFIVIYEGNPNEGPCAVEVCAPLRSGAPVPDGAATRTIPAHREAYVRVTKATVQSGGLGETYLGIERWIDEKGFDVAAAPRETYWTDFFNAADDAEVFDVAWPVR
jgi:hypothetical protein